MKKEEVVARLVLGEVIVVREKKIRLLPFLFSMRLLWSLFFELVLLLW